MIELVTNICTSLPAARAWNNEVFLPCYRLGCDRRVRAQPSSVSNSIGSK